MQASEKLYDKIASYLLGELEGEALKEFESSLMSDAELRKEVELHRQVSIHLSNAQEQDFKSNLANIRKSRFGTNQGVKRKSNTFKWIGIGFLLSALIYFAQIFLFDSTSNEKLLPEKQEQELQNSKTEEVGAESKVIDDNPAVNVSDKTTSAKSDIQNEPKKQRPILIEKEKENEKSDSQILAMSDFEPNKTLELLIGSKTRSAIYDFNVISKIEDSLYSSIDPVKIVFEGSVKEGSSLIGSDITFYVFSNKKESYDALAPLASADLKVERRNEGYIIKVEKNIFLKKGLYYYILETTDDEELIYINKFTIR